MTLRPLALALSLVVPVLALGCDEKKATPGDAPPASTTAAVSAKASAPAASSAAPAASSAAAPAGSAAPGGGAADGTWNGTAKSKVGAVTPPPDAKIETWRKDAGTDGVGDVTLKLMIAGRLVTGEMTGALGTAMISGDHDQGVVTARVDPKDPNQQIAWTGTLSGKVAGGAIDVKIRVSDRTANRAREVELKLAK